MSSLSIERKLEGYDTYHDPTIRTGQCGLFWYDLRLSRQVYREHISVASAQTKEHLLEGFASVYKEQSQRAAATLSRLQEIAPWLAEQLFVKPNPTEAVVLRLYNGETTASSKTYTAISYCWPDQDALPKEGDTSEDCVLAPFEGIVLQHLIIQRLTADEGLWCDQMCIDQGNEAEKAISVGAMDAIYLCAHTVHVVLYDIVLTADEMKLMLEYKKDYEDPKHGTWPPPHVYDRPAFFQTQPALHRLFVKICRSRWFTRAWCAHEFLLGTKFKFLVRCEGRMEGKGAIWAFGDYFLSNLAMLSARVGVPDDVVSVQEMIMLKCNSQRALTRIRTLYEKQKAAETKTHHEISLRVSRHPSQIKLPSWTLLLSQFAKLAAGGNPYLKGDARKIDAILDKSTIILNLTGSGLGVRRDPQQLAKENAATEELDAKILLITTAIAAGDPTALCTTGPAMKFCGDAEASSWLADLAYSDVGSGPARSEPFTPMKATSFVLDNSPSREWIELEFVYLGDPKRTDERYRRIASIIIDACSNMGLGGGFLGLSGVANTDGQATRYDIWRSHDLDPERAAMLSLTVANVLYLGLKWMLKTALHCGFSDPNELKDATTGYFSEGFDLHDLENLGWRKLKGGSEAVNAIIRFSFWMQAWNMMCTAPTAGKKPWIPLIFEQGWETPVMSFWPTDALAVSFVPLCLLQAGYERLPRVWILQRSGDPQLKSSSEDRREFLRCKTILFGVPSETEYAQQQDDGAITRPIRVHGPLNADLSLD